MVVIWILCGSFYKMNLPLSKGRLKNGGKPWTLGITIARYENAVHIGCIRLWLWWSRRQHILNFLLIIYFFQVIMKSCTGIDYGEFASFLKIIAKGRISFLNSFPASSSLHSHLAEALESLGPNHAVFDLQRVTCILESMLNNEDFKRLDPSTLKFQPEALIEEIQEATRSSV